MNEDVIGNASIGSEFDPILPDGWKPGDDLFALADQTEEPLENNVDGQSDEEFLKSQLIEENAEAAPTTDAPKAEEPNAEMTETSTVEEPSPAEGKKTSRILKAKVNHEEFEFDVNETPDEDIIKWRQKADAYDVMREAKAKETYRQVYQEQMDNGMTEAVAKLAAAAAADGKIFSLTDDEPEPTSVKDTVANEQITKLLNDMESMKQRMNDMVRQTNETVAAYQKENNILKQNAAAAAKAPVKPVSGGGDVTPPKEDPGLKGFDMDNW